jgi:hypothetical protein
MNRTSWKGWVDTRGIFLLVSAGLLAAVCPKAQAQLEGPEELKFKLETTYKAWRGAMMEGKFEQWRATTSAFRQAVTRNMIVSQKMPFPQALFEIPVEPPDLRGLRLLDIRSRGAQAQLVYAGDLGLAPPDAPSKDSLLSIRFQLEPSGWKYDSSRFMAIHTNPDIVAMLAKGDVSFLKGADFALPAQMPPVPEACPVPDHVAAVELISPGATTRALFRGTAYPYVTDSDSRDLLMGGLTNGPNTLEVEVASVEDAGAAGKGIEVSLLLLEDGGKEGFRRVWTVKVAGKPGKTSFFLRVSPSGTVVQE